MLLSAGSEQYPTDFAGRGKTSKGRNADITKKLCVLFVLGNAVGWL